MQVGAKTRTATYDDKKSDTGTAPGAWYVYVCRAIVLAAQREPQKSARCGAVRGCGGARASVLKAHRCPCRGAGGLPESGGAAWAGFFPSAESC